MSEPEIDRRKELLEAHYAAYEAWIADPSIENTRKMLDIELKLKGLE